MMTVQLGDLRILMAAHARFELTQSVEDLSIDELETVCARVLASDPVEPLAFRLRPIIEHAREIQSVNRD
jgi:hypothetical protein